MFWASLVGCRSLRHAGANGRAFKHARHPQSLAAWTVALANSRRSWRTQAFPRRMRPPLRFPALSLLPVGQVANIVAGVDGWLQEIASEGFVALSRPVPSAPSTRHPRHQRRLQCEALSPETADARLAQACQRRIDRLPQQAPFGLGKFQSRYGLSEPPDQTPWRPPVRTTWRGGSGRAVSLSLFWRSRGKGAAARPQ